MIENAETRNMTGNKRSDVTKQKILAAARAEFAEKGLYGTRVDEIAVRAGVNKRMMYVYFGNKDELYATILKTVFSELSIYEQAIDTGDSVESLVRKYYKFLSSNPDFVKLALWENLNDSKYLISSGAAEVAGALLDKLAVILADKTAGNPGLADTDFKRLAATINGMCLSVYANSSCMSALLGKDLTTEDGIDRQADYICRIISSYIR